MHVYKAIAAVQGELAKEGIAKDRNNQQQGYKFRGIDDVYNALAPYLSKHGLCVLPRGISREITERVNAKGTALFYVTVAMEFDFVSSEDGSKHTIGPMYGEAMDSGDKATNKAMSAAYKYACMQAFCIPTEGDNDADATTHEVQPQRAQSRQQAPKSSPQPPQGDKPKELSPEQIKYQPRLLSALHTLHGDDTAAKKATVKANSALPAKGNFPAREGVEDYRTLDGDRLKFLTLAVEKLAAGKVDKDFETVKNESLANLEKDMQPD